MATVTTELPPQLSSTGNATVDNDDTSGDFFFALYYVTVPLLFGLITCSGVIGNGLVIHVILFRKRMRTVTNLLLLNLAFADLSFVLVIPPFTAYQFAADRWPFGDAACKLLHYLVNVTAYVTVYTLVLVAVIRYMTVVHSARTARFRTPRITIALIVGIWLLMLTVNTPILLIYGAVRKTEVAQGRPTDEEDCDLYVQDYGRGLFATFFAFGYVFPLAVIGLFSIQILHDIMRHRPQAPGLRRSKSIRRKKQIGRLLLLVVVIFAVLWLPVHIHLLVAFFGQIPTHKAYNAVSTLWHCLAYFNSCVNPVIYNHTSKEFRDAFSSTVSCFQASQSSASTPTSASAAAAAAGCKENGKHRLGKADVGGVLKRMRRSKNVVQKFQFIDGEDAGSPDREQVVEEEDN